MAEQDYVRLAAACHCGQPVKLWPGRGRKPKYCDEHASPPVKERKTKECPGCRGIFICVKANQTCCSKRCVMRVKRGSKPRDEVRAYICEHCKAQFTSTYWDRMYCGKRCKQEAWRQNNPDRLKELRVREQPKLCAYVAKHCDGCGQAGGQRRAWTECPACTRAKQLAAGREASFTINLAQHNSAGKVVRCAGCDLEFCPLYGTKERSACAVCKPEVQREMRRAAKDKRDERIKSATRETVVARKVFQRDGWLCRLCGIATPECKRGTYDHDAPELDHDVPVSRGGAHSYANTQCLCRSCNGWKGARTMDEALAALAA